MTVPYEIVPYRPELLAPILELQTHLWSRDTRRNASYFAWKYEENPYRDAPLVYLALDGGRVVGMRGFFGVTWEAGRSRQRHAALYADDVVVAPEHRDRGVMVQIMRTALEDLARRGERYLFNLSAGSVTFVSSLASGWRSAGPLRPMRRRARSSSARARLQAWINRSPFAWRFADLLARRSPLPAGPVRATPSVVLESVPRCDAMARLTARLAGPERIRHVRDAPYFAWRLRNPQARYRFLYPTGPDLEGFMALRQSVSERADRETIAISDWEASSEDVRRDLLRAALACTAGRDLVVWTATLEPDAVGLLREHGFEDVVAPRPIDRNRPALLVRALDDSPGTAWELGGLPLLDLASWDLRMLDSMHG